MEGRSPESVVFEAEYWKQINLELVELHTEISAAANGNVTAVVALADIAVLAIPQPRLMASVEQAVECMTSSMTLIQGVQQRLVQIGELVSGRLNVLFEELGMEPPTEGEPHG